MNRKHKLITLTDKCTWCLHFHCLLCLPQQSSSSHAPLHLPDSCCLSVALQPYVWILVFLAVPLSDPDLPWNRLCLPPVWASVCPVRILDLTCELYPRVGTVEEGGFCANTGTRRPWKTLLPEGVVPPAQSCWDSAPCCSASGWRIWSHPCHPSLLPVCHYENKLKLLFFPHIWVFFTILEIQLFLFLSFMGVT